MAEELKISEREAVAVGEAMAQTYSRDVHHLMKTLKWSAQTTFEALQKRRDVADRTLEEIENATVQELDWVAFEVALDHSPEASLRLWRRVRREAVEELQSGLRGATVVADRRYTPMEFARYLALREALGRDWQARGSIEDMLLDQLAQCHTEYMHWLSIANGCSLKVYKEPTDHQKIYDAPRVDEVQAEDHALAMADRCQRMFMRALRNLLAMRRYPIIVQNAGQVNVGSQQVNLAQSGKNSVTESPACLEPSG